MGDLMGFAYNASTLLLIKPDNTVWEWGDILGTYREDTVQVYTEPTLRLENVVSVSVGSHAIALTSNGELYCWGRGSWGQLGNGGTERSLEPVWIGDGYMLPTGRPASIGGTAELAPVNLSPPQYTRTGVGVTGGNVCAVARPDGTLWAWGNSLGEEPTQYLDNVAYVSADSHIMALQTDGSLWGLGLNTYNQIDKSGENGTVSPSKSWKTLQR